MKIYHKFFLYQNKLLQPYVRLLLRLMAIITYLASIMLIVGVIYEHGFTLSAHEVTKIHLLYKTVWIIFLIDVTLHILLEYRDTKKNFRKLAWILSWLLYLTLIPVIFIVPKKEGLSCICGSSYTATFITLSCCYFFSFEFIERIGTPFRKADESFSDFGCQLSGDYFNRSGIVDVASLYSRRCYIIVGRCTVYFYQCRMCNRAGTC